MPELATGTLIDGRYKVVSRLGAGGMADVFLAEDQQLGRNVALKLLYRRFAEDPGFVERFRREAQAAAGLQHPNVVSVYDRGAYDDTYYIAMEYLPGRSLKQLIRREAPIDQLRAIDITIQILKAARFAHRHGVIHRDLKPHNVIVDETDHAKVTDFGIARAGASDMTETGSIMGTAQYLSPEQAQGHAVSASSDLYSIGVVLYEMLTGRVPFDAESAVTIALKHVSEAPTPPRVLNPDISPELEQVVLWTLNKDPADRPADADQLITALTRVRELIVSESRGQRTSSMAALGVIPVDGGGAELQPPEPVAPWDGAEDGAGWEEPYERRRRWWPWLVALLVLLLIGGGVAAYLLTRPAKKVVPAVTGQLVNNARTELQNDGFSVAVISAPSSQSSGIVIGQDPSANVKANKGSTVTLTVSSGPGNASVPAVRGLPLAEAKRMIRRAHLRVGRVVSQSSQTVVAGDVISTDPGAGQNPLVGTRVTVTVSTGKPTATVPSVVGETESAATQALKNAGFTVSTSTQTSSTATAGNVVSQSPGGNTVAVVGTNVSLVDRQGSDYREGARRQGRHRFRRSQPADRCRVHGRQADEDRDQGQERWDRRIAEPGPGRQREEGEHGHDRRRALCGASTTDYVHHHAEHHDDPLDHDADDDIMTMPAGRARPCAWRFSGEAAPPSTRCRWRRPPRCRAGLVQAGHVPIAIEVGRDGVWRRDGRELEIVPGRGLEGADVVFPALHGPFGEDGTVQGLLECLDIPYVGAGVLASALCMDKVLFKQLMARAGIPQVDHEAVHEEHFRDNPAAELERLRGLGLPVFVKPARLGSSVGIERVADAGEMAAALATAFEHDELAIVEAACGGIEVECSVLGNGDPIASQPGEILLGAGESGWYDYEAKYTPGGMELVVPARIPGHVRERVRSLAVTAFVTSGCRGLARVDFFVDGEDVLVNELNTMPGFTETSVYAALFGASGIPYAELLDRLVALGERHEAEGRHRF